MCCQSLHDNPGVDKTTCTLGNENEHPEDRYLLLRIESIKECPSKCPHARLVPKEYEST